MLCFYNQALLLQKNRFITLCKQYNEKESSGGGWTAQTVNKNIQNEYTIDGAALQPCICDINWSTCVGHKNKNTFHQVSLELQIPQLTTLTSIIST